MKKLFCIIIVLTIALTTSGKVFAEGDDSSGDKPILAGWDKGFFLKSVDEKFKLGIQGNIAPSYKFETRKKNPDITKAQNTFDNTFLMGWSTLKFKGTAYQKYSLNLEMDYATYMGAYPEAKTNVSYKPNEKFEISAGQVSMPMQRKSYGIFLDSPVTTENNDWSTNSTIERKKFGISTQTGVVIESEFGRFRLKLGASNGGKSSAFNANNEFSYTGRMEVDILDEVKSSYDYYFNERPQLTYSFGAAFEDDDAVDGDGDLATTWKDTDAQLNNSTQFSTDLAFRWKGFALTMEGYYRRIKVSNPERAIIGADGYLTDVGYYIDTSYFVIPKKFAIGGRATQVFREGPSNDIFEFSGGVMSCLAGDNVRWHLEYSYLLDYDETLGFFDQASHRLQTKIEVKF